MTHRILHLSDTHIGADGRDEDGVEAAAALDGLLADVRHLDGVDLVLVTGDLADDGSVAGGRAVRERVDAFAAERGVPAIYTTGNHDRRPEFAEVFGCGHPAPTSTYAGPELAAASDVGGLRVVTLDTLVPGQVHGVVSAGQLAWLAEVLAEPAPDGTVIAFHHPPIHVAPSPTASYGLRNGDDLAAVVDGSDVRAILCGHYHHQLVGHLRGVPVSVTPGVVTRIDLTAPAALLRGVRGAGATVVDLGGPFSPAFHVLHARDPRAGEQVYLADVATGADATEPR